MAAILRQLCFIPTLSIQLNRYINLNKETFDYYCHLIESFKIIDDSNQALRFHNLLRCLKNLIQCDQIKDQLTKQMEFHYFFVV
ncbi:unnamed protein product [Rotaria magnacalcarata]|uniref:Uncharacterized protein n=1 Tax=Rotaria magnacalcarata TaxID=392030 RepID=A0A814W7X9_9BILA|nr:unnamed protein product [Rotaria magnacalcarata]CAF1685588.1 unnamed protein product [Rotaria magnacalcarata]